MKYIAILILFSISIPIIGQEVWTLQNCIDYANDNNLQIKLAELGVSGAEISKSVQKKSKFPGLNFSTSYGYNFGRTIDPSSNDFSTQTIGYNQFSIGTGATIYNGGKQKNSEKRASLDLSIAKDLYNQTIDDATLSIANIYLQILFAEENLAISKENQAATISQRDKLKKLIDAGSRPKSDIYSMNAQLAQIEKSIVFAENEIENQYLKLTQSLRLDKKIVIEKPTLGEIDLSYIEKLSASSIYNKALYTQNYIIAGEKEIEKQILNEKIAKADMLPKLDIFGSISSNYSSLAKSIDTDNITIIPSTENVLIGDNPETITFYRAIPSYNDKKYTNQITDNLGQSIGLKLTIPIYNKGMVKGNIERAKLGMEKAKITDTQNKERLFTTIQTYLANSKAAAKEYNAAMLSVEANQAAFDNAKIKLELGSMNSFDYSIIQSDLDKSKFQTLIAKYKYFFNMMVLKYYQGESISF